MAPLTKKMNDLSTAPLMQNKLIRLALSLTTAVLLVVLLNWSTGYMRNDDAPKLFKMGVALLVGVFGVWGIYWVANDLLDHLPFKARQAIRPYLFIAPAVALLTTFLVYPAVNTIYISLTDIPDSASVWEFPNYVFAFTNEEMHIAFRNNLLWLFFGTTFSVGLGLVIATLVDKIKYEAAAKSLIFMPMAISFVGASVIWKFVYAWQPANRPQIGLLNAMVTGLGGEPIAWLLERDFNTFALIAIMVWLQTGFAMVILSAALKGVPRELIEAARIDGANEVQIFFQVIIPVIRGAIITVATTVFIAILKVFDIVYVMTSGKFDTEVVANRMYREMFNFRNYGHAGALAVILLLVVVPIMVLNIRNLRRQGVEAH